MQRAWRWCSPAFDSSGTDPRQAHDRPTNPGHRCRAAPASACDSRCLGRPDAVRADARAHHSVLGRFRVHHRRTRSGDSPPARKSAVRHSGARVGAAPVGTDYARRINLFAAVTSAASAGLWFLIGERWLRPIVPPPAPPWARRLAAAAGALVAATGFTVWNQSVVNEKVYTVSVLSIALVLWLVVRWADQTPPPETRRDHHLVLIVYLLALTATNHLMGVLVAPAVLVYVLATDPRALRRRSEERRVGKECSLT